jgi:hypothetical protein
VEEARLLEPVCALVQDGLLERNTVPLQKPFTAKNIVEVIQQMNVSVRG